jgi:hypothetical protein
MEFCCLYSTDKVLVVSKTLTQIEQRKIHFMVYTVILYDQRNTIYCAISLCHMCAQRMQ